MPEVNQEQATVPQARLRSYSAALVRSGAVLVAVVYGTGFVILAGHDAHYGIFEFDLLRARVFLVGFVFIVLCALSAAARHYSFAYFSPLSPVVENTDRTLRIKREVVLTAGFVFTAFIIAGQFGFYLFAANAVAAEALHKFWLELAAGVPAVALMFTAYSWVGKRFATQSTKATLVAVAASAAFVGLIYIAGETIEANMTVWFVLIALFVLDVKSAQGWARYALDFRSWFNFLAILVFYVVLVFGTIQPRFGGGAPLPAVLYLNQPVAWLKAGPVVTSLVDETNQGFYVLLGSKKRALFLPRSSVAAVYFGPSGDVPTQSGPTPPKVTGTAGRAAPPVKPPKLSPPTSQKPAPN